MYLLAEFIFLNFIIDMCEANQKKSHNNTEQIPQTLSHFKGSFDGLNNETLKTSNLFQFTL